MYVSYDCSFYVIVDPENVLPMNDVTDRRRAAILTKNNYKNRRCRKYRSYLKYLLWNNEPNTNRVYDKNDIWSVRRDSCNLHLQLMKAFYFRVDSPGAANLQIRLWIHTHNGKNLQTERYIDNVLTVKELTTRGRLTWSQVTQRMTECGNRSGPPRWLPPSALCSWISSLWRRPVESNTCRDLQHRPKHIT
ncbi:hypothetical protein J6590_039751 [Homalodisca vitripennis]|nr:hypothetical protein J6590_039751 [Homalodisca vitripennis]